MFPDFNEKYLEIGEEVQFLIINMTDDSRETVETASAFIAEQGYSFPVFYDADVLLKDFGIRRHIHERQLEVDGAVEKIQEGAPLFENRGLVFLLGQLIVDVLILDGLGIILVADTADAIREHTLEWDRLLRGAGNAVITPCAVDNLLNLPCLSLSQILRHVQVSFFCFSEQTFHRKQCDLPPFLPVPDGSGRHSSCSSDRDGPSALQTWPE